MERAKKIHISCALLVVLVIAAAVALFVWSYFSVGEPIKGWQEDPSTPHTPPKVHLTPFPKTSTPG